MNTDDYRRLHIITYSDYRHLQATKEENYILSHIRNIDDYRCWLLMITNYDYRKWLEIIKEDDRWQQIVILDDYIWWFPVSIDDNKGWLKMNTDDYGWLLQMITNTCFYNALSSPILELWITDDYIW